MRPEQAQQVHDALFSYWTSRDDAEIRQQARGATADVGGRAGVTSGGHLDRIAQLLAHLCIDAGAPPEAVWYKAPPNDPYKRNNAARGYRLPGYFRPTKDWDLVVYHKGAPIVIVELKSQNGPSYGNNANNRAEEAIGSAVDLEKAREAGLIPGDPWTGYVFVIEDDFRSKRSEAGRDASLLRKDKYFDNWSYIDRVRLLSRRLVDRKLYDAAWAVATSRPTCPGLKKPKDCPQIKYDLHPHSHKFSWWELQEDRLGYARFADEMTSQVRRYYS